MIGIVDWDNIVTIAINMFPIWIVCVVAIRSLVVGVLSIVRFLGFVGFFYIIEIWFGRFIAVG